MREERTSRKVSNCVSIANYEDMKVWPHEGL